MRPWGAPASMMDARPWGRLGSRSITGPVCAPRVAPGAGQRGAAHATPPGATLLSRGWTATDFRGPDVQGADGGVRGWRRSSLTNHRGLGQSGRDTQGARLGARTRHQLTARALAPTSSRLHAVAGPAFCTVIRSRSCPGPSRHSPSTAARRAPGLRVRRDPAS